MENWEYILSKTKESVEHDIAYCDKPYMVSEKCVIPLSETASKLGVIIFCYYLNAVWSKLQYNFMYEKKTKLLN